MRGREHPIVLPDALHTAHTYYVRASVPQCSSLCIRFPQRDAYPSGCDGNRTRYGLLAKPWPVDLRPHPTILFPGLPAGESDPGVGGRTPFAGLAPAVLEVHAPSRRFSGQIYHPRPPQAGQLPLPLQVLQTS